MDFKMISITHTLSPALNNINRDEYVFAQDIRSSSGSVVKRFIKGNFAEFESFMDSVGKEDSPEWLKDYHFYEVLQKDRPTKIFVDVETSSASYEQVRNAVDIFIKCLTIYCCSKNMNESNFYVLDSSSENKVSFHIIGGDKSPYFFDIFHVGALIRRITCFILHIRDTEQYTKEFPKDAIDLFFDDEGKYIIDDGIYTTNRFWRMCGSSKLGTNRILKCNKLTWKDCMVQYNDWSIKKELFECFEIDESIPISTNLPTHKLFKWYEHAGWVYIGTDNKKMTKKISYDCELLKPVLNFLNNNEHAELNINGKFDIFRGSWIYSSRSKTCAIANRTHRGNHIWFIINPWKKQILQKCFDQDCQHEEYRYNIPENCWDEWKKVESSTVNITQVV